MDVTLKDLRIAALINLWEIAWTDDLRECISNELWCLRNDVSTEGLEDITLADFSTSDILKSVAKWTDRSPEEQAALLVCTLQEIS